MHTRWIVSKSQNTGFWVFFYFSDYLFSSKINPDCA